MEWASGVPRTWPKASGSMRGSDTETSASRNTTDFRPRHLGRELRGESQHAEARSGRSEAPSAPRPGAPRRRRPASDCPPRYTGLACQLRSTRCSSSPPASRNSTIRGICPWREWSRRGRDRSSGWRLPRGSACLPAMTSRGDEVARRLLHGAIHSQVVLRVAISRLTFSIRPLSSTW